MFIKRNNNILQISHLFLYIFGQLSNYFRCSLQPDEDGGAIPAVRVRTYVREVLLKPASTMLRLVSRIASGLFLRIYFGTRRRA